MNSTALSHDVLEAVAALPPEVYAAARARRHLGAWCTFVDPRYRVAEHHRTLIDALERVERGEITRLIVTMPPRHGKSLTSTTYFPDWFLGRHPDEEVIVASYGAKLAEDFSRAARNTLQQHGKTVFDVEVADDSKSVEQWRIKGHYGGLNAAGVDGSLTGKGARLLIIDDPHKNKQEAYSEVFRAQVKGFYTAAARTRLAPGGAIVVIQTRWHEDDLAGWLLAEQEAGGEEWHVVTMPMVAPDGELLRLAKAARPQDLRAKEHDPVLDQDLRHELLWPDRFGPDLGTPRKLARFIRTIGSTDWESLYMQRPTPAEGGIIKAPWVLNRWRAPGADAPIVPGTRIKTLTADQLAGRGWDDLIIVADCTFKKLEDNDRVCILVAASKGPDVFVLDARWDRMGFPETCSAISDLRVRYPRVSGICIEDKANGSAVIEVLRGRFPGVIALQPDGGKEARTQASAPIWEAGNVWLPDDAPWVADAVQELLAFPRARHDDFVDAVTYAVRRLAEGSALAYARSLCEW